jgi:hypothetical protein
VLKRVFRLIVGMLLVGVGVVSAQIPEDYRWEPLFDPGVDTTYKSCEALQKEVAQREKQRSEAHERCLAVVKGDCPSDPRTGCSCQNCARWHGPDEYMERQLKICMDSARLLAEQHRQAEERKAQEKERAAKAQEAAREAADRAQQILAQGQSPPADASSLPSPEYDPLRPGVAAPSSVNAYPPPSSDPGATARQSSGAPAETPGSRLAASMPAFDDLLRHEGVDFANAAGHEAIDRWDPTVGEAIHAATGAIAAGEHLASWVSFIAGAGEPHTPEQQLSRIVFGVGETAQALLSEPQSFAFSASLTTLHQTTADVSSRLQLVMDAFDDRIADPWEAMSRATDFSQLIVSIATSMCPWCERGIRIDAAVRESWPRFGTFLRDAK